MVNDVRLDKDVSRGGSMDTYPERQENPIFPHRHQSFLPPPGESNPYPFPGKVG